MTMRDDIITFYFLSSHSIRDTAKYFDVPASLVGTFILCYKRELGLR
jgi:hypothetical protein